jgi:hypothetical protein
MSCAMVRTIVLPLLCAALVGLIFLGPSSASASVLCEANENPCSSENLVENEAQLFWNAKLNFGGAIVCNSGGSFEKVTDMGGEGKAVKAEMTSLLLSCVEGGVQCWPVGGGNLPYDTEFQGSGGNGTMVLSDPVAVKITTQCAFKTCVFSTTSKIEPQFTGGNPAVMAANSVPVSSGPGCPTTMSIELKTGALPASLFIVNGPANPATRLCKQNTSPCPKANRHAIGTAIEGSLEGNSVFEFLYEGKPREPACEEGTLTGKTTVAGKPLIGEVSAMSFGQCGAGVCAVQAQNLAYKAEIEKTTGGNGTLALVSGGSGSPRIEVNCGKAFKCVYKAASVSFTLTGSASTPKLAVSQTLEKDAASEAECGASMTWKATYKVTKPTPLFVT